MEVIHAAYRSLAAMYHPDRHIGDPEAERIMRVINNSFAALCDPVRKRDHDRWIEESDAAESNVGQESRPVAARKPPIELPPQPTRGLRKHWMLLVTAGVLLSVILFGIFFTGLPDNRANVPNIITPNDIIEPGLQPKSIAVVPHPRYAKPALTPLGNPWPAISGYLPEYAQLNTNGRSSLTVDNQQNDSDMLVKLYIRVGPRPTAVRVLFLKAKDSFEIETIAPGPYDLRYQDLDSGIISKSEPFPLEEKHEDIPQSDGILHRSSATNMSLTLYTVINGNTHSEVIGPEDFR